MEGAGRWALARSGKTAQNEKLFSAEAVEHVARTLLARYGVVFWRSLEREAAWLPPWRDLLRVYRRLEARGDIRGGRFVAGFSGEQFALPEAIGLLRETRRKSGSDDWVSLSAADPLNLIGILTPRTKTRGARPAIGCSIVTACRSSLAGGETRFYQEVDSGTEWQAQRATARSATSPEMADLTAR